MSSPPFFVRLSRKGGLNLTNTMQRTGRCLDGYNKPLKLKGENMKVPEGRLKVMTDLVSDMDTVADENDHFVVEVDNRRGVIYVHCNGETVVRIGRIKKESIQLIYHSDVPTGG